MQTGKELFCMDNELVAEWLRFADMDLSNEMIIDKAQTKIAISNAEAVKTWAENILCRKQD